jgi:hypothetical protein
MDGTVYIAIPDSQEEDRPEWLRVTYTALSFQVNVLTRSITMVGGSAWVEVGDTPSGSADLSVSSGSLNGQLTLNGQPVGTLIIQPPFVVLVPGADIGGGASCQRQITITRNGQKIYESNLTRTASGVVGSRTYRLNGTVYVASTGTPPPGEDLPEWVKLTFTDLLYQVDLLTHSVTFAGGIVQVQVGDSPAATARLSVSSGSLSGTLEMNGQTVATIRVVNGLIVIVPVTS